MAKQPVSMETIVNDEPTQSFMTAGGVDPEEIAQKPEVKSAFEKVFGDEGKTSTSGRNRREEERRAEEETESLASLEESKDDDSQLYEDFGGDKTKDDSDEQEVEKTDTTVTDDPGGEDSSLTLPAVLRHAAKRNGWQDAEIDEFWTENPERAERTFDKLYVAYNDLTSRYAQMGMRNLGAPDEEKPPTPKSKITGEPIFDDDGKDLLTEIYGDELKDLSDKFGDDFMKRVMEPAMQKLAAKVMGPVKQVYQFYENEQSNVINQEVNRYFASIGKEFHEFYGNAKKVDDRQMKSRHELGTLADQIRTGATIQGVDMSVTEALERAMLSHSAQHVETLERKRITEQVKKRSSQRSHRPTQRKGGAGAPGGQRSVQAAEEAAQQKMMELGLIN